MDKAVGNVQYDTCYILASYSVSMLQSGTSKENLIGKIESVSDKLFPISYEERSETRNILQDGVTVVETISYSKKVIAFSGCIGNGAEACNEAGIDAYFPILQKPCSLQEAMNTENAYVNLKSMAMQVFKLF